MFQQMIQTDRNLGALFLRLGLGCVIFPHGAGKVLGWFGGYGLSATLQNFTEGMGIPLIFAVLAIAAEFLGSLGLITGLLTRVAAFGIGVTMTVAALMAHVQNGFFMNWFGQQKGEGFEYHVLAVAMSLALIITGGGCLSIDRYLTKKCAFGGGT
ncbi:MAG: hypothetical protein A3I75_01170 [Deltaproteobacteria bacterium RIFCSPLOWO2_02_FULL_50_16]|nr:MAG: hypothetical protein A3B79_03340 [Deltaproteobacteria bacterium RIFCSPHIGHO2_02_FULL_50_15]OGQ58374.1 MAG: hypothetical protein A3I75_01170 [Deltaproteobacteria bacterium RIFCSPLOWO2_02_FULL_50_16]